jgi:hypothetical protein
MRQLHAQRLAQQGLVPASWGGGFAGGGDNPDKHHLYDPDGPMGIPEPPPVPEELLRDDDSDLDEPHELPPPVAGGEAEPATVHVGDHPLARVARAGFNVAGHMGNYSKEALKNNIAGTIGIAASAASAASHAGRALGSASMRAASSSKERVMEGRAILGSAMEPGSNTRQALSQVATSAQHAMETVGPPIIYGAAAAAGHAVTVAGHAAAVVGHTAQGVGHVTREYALPAARTVGQGAAAAASAALPVVQNFAMHSMGVAARVLSASVLSSADILSALGEFEKERGYSAHNALENGAHAAIGNGRTRRSRLDSPSPMQPRGNTRPTSTVPRPDHSYNSAQEWLEYSHNRGILVEELYKRPNWKEFISTANAKNDLRKKLLTLSPHDLADILVKLDQR